MGAAAASLLSEATRHLRTTVCPAAEAGKFTRVATNPLDAELHAWRFAIGLLNPFEIAPVYPPSTKLPPAVTMSVKGPPPILISRTAPS